jgi:hypothetical protein
MSGSVSKAEEPGSAISKVAAVYLRNLCDSTTEVVRHELERRSSVQARSAFNDDMPAWIVQKYAKIAKVQRKTDAHTLRHSCGTHLYDNGADVRCIQELLGHKSLDTTMIYVQIRATKLRKVLQKTHPREKGIVYAPEMNESKKTVERRLKSLTLELSESGRVFLTVIRVGLRKVKARDSRCTRII